MTDENLKALIAELETCGELDNLRMPYTGWLCDCPEEVLRLRARERALVEHLRHAITCELDAEEIAEIRAAIDGGK